MFIFSNILIVYLMGALIALGLTHTVDSLDMFEEKTSVGFYIGSALFSWVTVGAFGIGVLKGLKAVFWGN